MVSKMEEKSPTKEEKNVDWPELTFEEEKKGRKGLKVWVKEKCYFDGEKIGETMRIKYIEPIHTLMEIFFPVFIFIFPRETTFEVGDKHNGDERTIEITSGWFHSHNKEITKAAREYAEEYFKYSNEEPDTTKKNSEVPK